MIVITGTIRIPKGSLQNALPAMTAMIEASRNESGCLSYSYSLDVLDDGLIHVNEAWKSDAALAAHFDTPHLKHWRSQFAELGITERNLVKLTIAESQPV